MTFDTRSRPLESLPLDRNLMSWNIVCHFYSELASMWASLCAWIVALAFTCPLIWGKVRPSSPRQAAPYALSTECGLYLRVRPLRYRRAWFALCTISTIPQKSVGCFAERIRGRSKKTLSRFVKIILMIDQSACVLDLTRSACQGNDVDLPLFSKALTAARLWWYCKFDLSILMRVTLLWTDQSVEKAKQRLQMRVCGVKVYRAYIQQEFEEAERHVTKVFCAFLSRSIDIKALIGRSCTLPSATVCQSF